MRDLAVGRLEVPNLMTGRGAYVGAIEHDDGPGFIGCCGIVRLVMDSHDLRCGLPVVRLEPQGDRVGADAHTLVRRRRGRQSKACRLARMSPPLPWARAGGSGTA